MPDVPLTVDNLERFPGVGGTREVSRMVVYSEVDTVGPSSDFTRDFYEGTEIVTADSHPSQASDLSSNVSNDNKADVIKVGGVESLATLPTAASNFSVYQSGVSPNPALCIQGNPSRQAVTFLNNSDTLAIAFGPNSAVSMLTGFVLKPGSSFTMAVTSEVWFISEGQGATVCIVEYLNV